MATTSVRIDSELFKLAELMGKALSRTTPKQIEHWAKIGRMMEENPNLSYQLVKDKMIARAGSK